MRMASSTPQAKLSADQSAALARVMAWIATDSSLFRLGGLAGTGKTTLLGHLATTLPADWPVAYVAYTGRAASVLARKFRALGIESTSRTQLPEGQALKGRALDVCYSADSEESLLPFVGTIHRLLYRPIVDPKTEELRGWSKRDQLDRDYALIVIDEASMVGDDVLADLQRFQVPILAVGDHGQLPPVMSAGSLMRDPDVRLEKIHRQAAGNPVIALAHHLREGGLFREFSPASGDKRVAFYGKNELARVLEEADLSSLATAVICWTNRMRVRLNGLARSSLGLKGPPRQGDLVVALKNYPPICNGMRGVLPADSTPGKMPWELGLSVTFPEEDLAEHTIANAAQFNREKPFASVDELKARGIDVSTVGGGGRLYDFGYAMTAHKYQGSQAAHVIIFVDRPEDPSTDDWRRWIYTAVTRSSDRLTVLR